MQEVSSVLYLTPNGGPTLILEQKPSDPLAERGYLVQPCPNQLLAFKGDLLHGVLPGKHSKRAPPFAVTADCTGDVQQCHRLRPMR